MPPRTPPRAAAGRPQKSASALSQQQILTAALPLVQAGGIEAISFRRLSEHLGVTPMAVKYHVGDQRQMLAALIDIAFAGTLPDALAKTPAEQLRQILLSYVTRALDNGELLRCILQDPALMSGEIANITAAIRSRTRQLNHGDPQDVMLNLLVDYSHGFLFSVLAAPPDNRPSTQDYRRSLDWLLAASPG